MFKKINFLVLIYCFSFTIYADSDTEEVYEKFFKEKMVERVLMQLSPYPMEDKYYNYLLSEFRYFVDSQQNLNQNSMINSEIEKKLKEMSAKLYQYDIKRFEMIKKMMIEQPFELSNASKKALKEVYEVEMKSSDIETLNKRNTINYSVLRDLKKKILQDTVLQSEIAKIGGED